MGLRTIAVVIGIEDYQFSDPPNEMHGVLYAKSDAEAMAEVIQESFGVHGEDLSLWINQNATASAFQNELRYIVSSLGPKDRFIFYYAGHGFHSGVTNHLTTWDSHPYNLKETTIPLRETLLDPLLERNCRESLLFLDACNVDLPKDVGSRDSFSGINASELRDFVQKQDHHAIYMACSPGGKSYPSPALKHGIWTAHLLKALKGEAKEALNDGLSLTDVSLRDYLYSSVEKYVRENTMIRGTQVPWASLNTPTTFQILEFKPVIELGLDTIHCLHLVLENYYLRRTSTLPFHSLPGFDKKRGHFIPDRISNQASNFASQLLAEEIAKESNQVFENSKSMLSLSRKQVTRKISDGQASVDTPLFRMDWSTSQNPQEATEAIINRILILLKPFDQIPQSIDGVFPVAPEEVIIPFTGKMEYDDIANNFEEIAQRRGLTFKEYQDDQRLELILKDGITIIIDLPSSELAVIPRKASGCISLLTEVRNSLSAFGLPMATLFQQGSKGTLNS